MIRRPVYHHERGMAVSAKARVAIAVAVLGALPGLAAVSSFGRADGRRVAGSGGCNLSYARMQIASYKRIGPWRPPGPSFDSSRAAGKTIFTIADNSANPFAENIIAGVKDASGKTGLKVVDYPNQGLRTQWIQGINAAIAQKAAGIVLAGGAIGPIYFSAQAAAARRAGAQIVTVVDTDLTQPSEPHVSARVAQPYVEAARLDADWIIMQRRCKADVLVITSNDVIAGDINAKAVRAEFARVCGTGCKETFVNVPVADWSTKIQPAVQAAVNRDRNLNYVLPMYDSMSLFVVPALRLAGAAKRVGVASFNGTPAILRMVQIGSPVTMDIGENETQLGYAAVDQMLRLLNGVRPIRNGDEHIRLRVFDKTNVSQAGRPPRQGAGYGSGWKAGYLKLWRIDK
jgi:ribose transport system substrate-binding protein